MKFAPNCLPVVYLLSMVLVFNACSQTKTKKALEIQSQVLQSTQRFEKNYVLSAGDAIEVVVYRHEDFSRKLMIRPDGYITLPVIDEVRAAGLTPKALDDRITALLSERLVDPEVSIILLNTEEPMVYVMGHVNAPSAIPARSARTAAQAIAKAGGIKTSGAVASIAVIRLDTDNYLKAFLVDRLDSSQPGWYMALNNMPVRADDVIFVPESNRSQFVRAINDFLNTPLGGLNQMLAPYFQFETLKRIDDLDE